MKSPIYFAVGIPLLDCKKKIAFRDPPLRLQKKIRSQGSPSLTAKKKIAVRVPPP